MTPDSANAASIQKLSTSADVASWLRERIRKGRLVPGQRLVEIDITRETGAGRSKVREAFQRLEAEGLVQIEEFRGASVRRAGMAEIQQIYRARMALEGVCAADFVRNASADQKARLTQLQDELDKCVHEHAPERFGKLNNEWHALIIEGAGNRVVRDVLNRLSIPINRLLFESFYDDGRLRKANADHQAITRAIIEGDKKTAEESMRHHIADGLATLTSIAGEFS